MSEAAARVEAREPSARYLAAGEPALTRGFELLASAPDGVATLRQLVRSLAVRGRLVPQEPCDDAAGAADRIRRATAEFKRARRAEIEEPTQQAGCFELPAGWRWVRLAQIAETRLGKMLDKAKNTGTLRPYLRNTNVQWHRFDLDDIKFIRLEDRELEEYRLTAGDLLVCEGGEPGRCAIWRDQVDEMYFQKALHRVRPRDGVIAEFIALCLAHDGQSGALAPYVTGATIKHFPGQQLNRYVLPLPPLAEQHRIVARVEELMKLCDALEARGRLADEQHARLTTTLFGLLAASESPQALADHWQRIAEHFDLLLDRPEAIDALEQTILQLAVRGRLVPHQESEGSGGALLARHRRAACTAGQRTRAQLMPLEDADAPFTISASWAWARFGEVADVSGGVTLGRKGALDRPMTLPYLRVANVQRGHLNLAGEVKTVTIDARELPRFELKPGDLLITEGGDWDKVGRTCTWRGEIATCLHQNHVFKARGWTSEWLPAWGELYLNSADARRYFAASAKQTTNLASINMTELRHCAFPLPPLAEQHRIVARVDELRRLCVQLRERLATAQQTQTRLADALVAQAIA